MIGGSTVLVTGANRGLGRALVRALAEAGCEKVYAAATNVASIASDRAVQPVGAVASALGAVGVNIEAIEIVEHRGDGVAVDDFFIRLQPGVMTSRS